jgi:hypothetical protein
VKLDLTDAAFDAAFEYAAQTNPDRPTDAIRELVLQAIAADEKNGAIRAARLTAFKEVKRELYREVNEALRSLMKRFDDPSLVSGESTPSLDNYVPPSEKGLFD